MVEGKMDFEIKTDEIANHAVESAAEEKGVPGKIVLLAPAVAGMALYGALTASPADLRAEWMEQDAEAYFVFGGFIVLQLFVFFVPFTAWRAGKGTMLGYRFKLCLFLWVTAYAIGFGILAGAPWIFKHV